MIIEAVGTIVISKHSSERKQQAAVEAILKLQAEGVTDPEILRQAQITAIRSTK
jgi:uncharacterized protein YoaH (UPF0181 family)